MKNNLILSILLIFVLFGVLGYKFSQGNYSTVSSAAQKPNITSPLPDPTGDRIAFVSDRTGNQEIYIMNLDTLKTENITNSPGNDMNPQVSNDGQNIVFYSDRDGDNEIYQLNLKTRELTQLTDNTFQDYDPSYSNSTNGSHIVFKSNRDDKLGDIFIMNQDGTNQINLTPTRDTTEEWDPSFTVDGERIIFVMRDGATHLNDEIYTMKLDGTDQQQITNNKVADWYPSVNPNDGTIVYISKDTPEAFDDIFKFNLYTGKQTLLTHLPGNDADPSWDFKGKKIVFINDNDKDYDLYIMNADGHGIRKIQDTPSDELSPIFLPPEQKDFKK